MRSRGQNAFISILFFVFGGPGVLLGYLPWWLTRFRIPADEPLWQVVIAGAVIVAGLVPLFESAVRFIRVGKGTLLPAAPTQHLVVSGLYRYVRNPMYVGVTMSLAAETVLFRSMDLLVELVLASLAIQVFVVFYEERTLAKRYGEEFAEYKRNVPRWVPRVRPWVGGK
jgi:protein-S-isoprenylcysteine O-methyltransferase Ste14